MAEKHKAWNTRLLESLVGKRTKAEVDLAKANERHMTKPSQPNDDDVASVVVPPDCPFYLKVYRLNQKTKDHKPPRVSTAFLGTTVELDYFTFGVKVYVRQGLMDGTLKVIVEDSEGREVVAHYEKDV